MVTWDLGGYSFGEIKDPGKMRVKLGSGCFFCTSTR